MKLLITISISIITSTWSYAQSKDTLYTIGREYLIEGKNKEAIQLLRQSLTKKPTFKNSFWLSYAYSKDGQIDSCAFYLAKCDQFDFPNNDYKMSYYKLSVWLYEVNNPKYKIHYTKIKTVKTSGGLGGEQILSFPYDTTYGEPINNDIYWLEQEKLLKTSPILLLEKLDSLKHD